jgi:NAD(P)H-dependent FMN reductase
MLKIAIILGSTRPGRNGEAVARWVHAQARKRHDAQYDLIDLKDVNLPLLDEPVPPAFHKYSKPHTQQWSERIAGYDGFVFVTAEYNHGIPAALKNAIDFLFDEWHHKAAGFVSYGSAGGVRAVEHLRGVMGEIMVADVRQQVQLMLATDFEDYTRFKPNPSHEKPLGILFDQVVAWSGALKPLRQQKDKRGKDVPVEEETA